MDIKTAKEKVARKLAIKDRAISEVEHCLKGAPLHVIDEVVQFFKKMGALDDRRWALRFVEKSLSRGWGPSVIAYRLREKKIDQDIIDDVIQSIDVKSVLCQILERESAFDRKLIAKLCRKGFPVSCVISCVEEKAKICYDSRCEEE